MVGASGVVALGCGPAVRNRLSRVPGCAVATAIITFAFDTSTVNGVRTPGKSHAAGASELAHQHHDTAAA